MTTEEPARRQQRPGEFDLIARYFRPLAAADGTFDLLDDASTLTPPPGHDVVLSVDMLAAGVHFFADDPAKSIARKALAVNLSDLAAKGAAPIGYLVSLALPNDWQESWVADFAEGLRLTQRQYGCQLLGGDTIKGAPSNGGGRDAGVQISITVIGLVRSGGLVRRAGARAGDALYVTGTLGDSALGLLLRRDSALAEAIGLKAPERDYLLDRYLHPEPRVRLAAAMQQFAHAGMDISDGFLGDLQKMATLAGLSAHIDSSLLPLSPAARAYLDRRPDALSVLLTGGDDYELLIALAPAAADALERAAHDAEVPLTRIGDFRANSPAAKGSTIDILDATGVPLDISPASFTHF